MKTDRCWCAPACTCAAAHRPRAAWQQLARDSAAADKGSSMADMCKRAPARTCEAAHHPTAAQLACAGAAIGKECTEFTGASRHLRAPVQPSAAPRLRSSSWRASSPIPGRSGSTRGCALLVPSTSCSVLGSKCTWVAMSFIEPTYFRHAKQVGRVGSAAGAFLCICDLAVV